MSGLVWSGLDLGEFVLGGSIWSFGDNLDMDVGVGWVVYFVSVLRGWV